jgi:hypothetical protein
MARKINKKSRRSAINKRTLRRNKSRVGGELVPPSLFPPSNPKFKFTFNKKTYVIEKKRGFSAPSTYSIYVDGGIPVRADENENIDCKNIIQNLDRLTADNRWLIYALDELIENYFTQTFYDKNSGRDPKKFEHFNELLIELIQYFTTNYTKFRSYTYPTDKKWYETAYQIQKIVTESSWCEGKFENNLVKPESCGSRPIQLDSLNLTIMFDVAARAAQAAEADI